MVLVHAVKWFIPKFNCREICSCSTALTDLSNHIILLVAQRSELSVFTPEFTILEPCVVWDEQNIPTTEWRELPPEGTCFIQQFVAVWITSCQQQMTMIPQCSSQHRTWCWKGHWIRPNQSIHQMNISIKQAKSYNNLCYRITVKNSRKSSHISHFNCLRKCITLLTGVCVIFWAAHRMSLWNGY